MITRFLSGQIRPFFCGQFIFRCYPGIIFDSIQTQDRTLLFSFYLLNIQSGGFVNRIQINSFFKFCVIQLIQFQKVKFFEYFLCIGIDAGHVDKSTVIDITSTSDDLLGKSEKT